MTFDTWFNEQSRIVQVLLLIIPFVGWVVEILVRLSALLRNPSGINLIGFILFIFLGGFWIPAIIDLIFLIIEGRLILTE